MLSIFFKDFFLILPFFIFLLFFWIFFIRNNFLSVRINPSSSDVLKNSKVLKKVHHSFFINWVCSNFIIFIIFVYFIKLDFLNFWFNHLKISNFCLNIILLIIFLFFFFFKILSFINNNNINFNMDYFSSLSNLFIFIPLIFLSNTMYTFIFLLELISLTILYKFSVSRFWFNNKNKSTFSRNLPKSYLNMMFFQYWANFFSSMLIFFSIFNLIFFFGSSEWLFLELLLKNNYYTNNLNIVVFLISFFLGMFLKIGFSPIHLFKIEVYKGLPFISIFFYTTVYFLSFFLYFIIILYNNLILLSNYYNIILVSFILIGLLYSLILLFDVNLTKSFFAYSTVVNAINFIIVLYLLIN